MVEPDPVITPSAGLWAVVRHAAVPERVPDELIAFVTPIHESGALVDWTLTEDVVAEAVTSFPAGTFTLRLPLGSFTIEADPSSLPFTLIPPPPASLLIAGTSDVTTDDGAGDIPEDTTEDGGEAPDLPAAPVAANDSNADRKRG